MMHILQHEVADYYRKRYAKKFIHLFPLSEFLLQEPVESADEVAEHVKHVLAAMAEESRELLLLKLR